LDNRPQSEGHIWAQTNLVQSYVALKNDQAAEAAYEQLLSRFSNNEHITAAMCDVALSYWDAGQPEKTKQVYEEAMNTRPDYVWERESDEIYHKVIFADSCVKLDEPQKALEIYQALTDTWAEAQDNLRAGEALILSKLALGNELNITQKLDGLIAEFADESDLPEVLFEIGENYGIKAYDLKNQGLETEAKEFFQEAVYVWERVILEFPDSDIVPQAYYCSAGSYDLELSEYEKAIEYYQKILDNWPYFDYQRASYAQFGITRCCQNLEKSGKMSAAEAAIRINQACNNLLSNYPGTNPGIIRAAQKLLDKYQVSE
jgi:tetratricopeptide (TPR) repeat protein